MSKSHLWPLIIIFFIGCLAYSNSFTGSFQFDDHSYIVNNPAVRDFRNIPRILKIMHSPTRLVGIMSFALNYHFHKLDVFGYHLINFIVHLISAYCVYWFVWLLFDTPRLKEYPLRFSRRNVAWVTALLFIAHPLQTQAVTYITQRFESLAGMFYLGSLCFYLYFRTEGVGGKRMAGSFVLSVLLAVLSMLTKEIAITIPLAILLIEVSFFKEFFENGKARQRISLLVILLLLIVPAIFSFKIQQYLFGTYHSESHVGDILTPPRYWLTQLRVFVAFLRLWFFPIGQNVDHDFPMSRHFLEPATAASGIFLSLLLMFSLRVRRAYPLVTFGILWFFVTLSSNIFPRTHVFWEHKMYLPSMGLSLLVASMLVHWIHEKKKIFGAVSVLVCIFVFLTFQRNSVWETEFKLWSDALKKSPHKPRAMVNLGSIYMRTGNIEKALEFFNWALKADPESPEAYNNRGLVYYHRKQFDLALNDYSKAIAFNSALSEAYINRAILYGHLEQVELALADYVNALKLGHLSNPMVYFNRGNLYAKQGDLQKAISEYGLAIQNYFEYPDVYRNRGNAYKLLGDYQKAIADYDKSLELNPEDGVTYYHRSLAYQAKGEKQKAKVDALKAQSLGYPVDPRWIQSL